MADQRELFLGRLLIVDDEASVRAFYDKFLTKAGYLVDEADSLGTMKERLSAVYYDGVIMDLELGAEHGFDGVAWILKEYPFTRVFVLTAHGSIERAVEAMKRGAAGFFEKGAGPERLLSGLKAELPQPLPRPVAATSPDSIEGLGLVGQSEALREVWEKIERLRDVDSTVLILGESGTGKEVVARAIHRTSARAGGRFDAINCGAIPENLLESELFGHRRGAFTDAKADRKGIFELCSDGTLLLDEIGDMPMSLQTKLLRVLQEREITPIGGSNSVKIDTRVIAATHRDIFFEAKAKRFREDLFYRLSIVVLRIPPLRHRLEDVPVLVSHFLDTFNKRFSREVKSPSPSTLARLTAYDWPGNVRELQNAVERAVVLSTDGELTLENMFSHLMQPSRSGGSSSNDDAERSIAATVGGVYELPLTEAKQAFERDYLDKLLRRCKGNIVEAASQSGRYRADVYRLLARYGLDQTEYR